MAKIQVGDEAPQFTLPAATGETFGLAQALDQGPVVLIFYPMDNTPGCKAQLCAVRDDAAKYAAAGIRVWAINNGSAQSHRNFAEKNGFAAPLLVDKDFAVAGAYNAVLGFGPVRVIQRTVVGIGPDGRVSFYKRGSPATDEIIGAVGSAA